MSIAWRHAEQQIIVIQSHRKKYRRSFRIKHTGKQMSAILFIGITNQQQITFIRFRLVEQMYRKTGNPLE
jgi:hypothetical protein